ELERWQRLLAVRPLDDDTAEERHAVGGEVLGRNAGLIEIDEPVATHEALGVRVGANLDVRAALAGAHLEAATPVRERIGAVLVEELDVDEKLGLLLPSADVVDVADVAQIQLAPELGGSRAAV